jgi:hypothetical protein
MVSDKGSLEDGDTSVPQSHPPEPPSPHTRETNHKVDVKEINQRIRIKLFPPEIRKKIASSKVRKNILERFVIQDDKKRKKFAIKRDQKNSRVLLRSQDVILYDGVAWGFFDGADEPGQSFLPAWEQTIQEQQEYVENNHKVWQKPDRFVLAMVMARWKHALDNSDKNMKPADITTIGAKKLLSNVYSTGLLPLALRGKSDDFTRRSRMQTPYVLLRLEHFPQHFAE